MSEAGLIRHGWAGRIPVDVIERLIRRVLPAITDDDLAAAFEQASYEVVEEADRLRQFVQDGAPDSSTPISDGRTGPP